MIVFWSLLIYIAFGMFYFKDKISNYFIGMLIFLLFSIIFNSYVLLIFYNSGLISYSFCNFIFLCKQEKNNQNLEQKEKIKKEAVYNLKLLLVNLLLMVILIISSILTNYKNNKVNIYSSNNIVVNINSENTSQ